MALSIANLESNAPKAERAKAEPTARAGISKKGKAISNPLQHKNIDLEIIIQNNHEEH
ncbi:MAG TPA: hypothetical protein VLZ29_03455 [Sulfurimonas sp.]|uniref:hypothetical protein n=1 Tax=Sulfurimonas sp. TaxID=2022749 RepID=UPI002B924136|nr:hypothetical protein [Sulfurimonas sp.]HUH42149.1 hypothetical protein [Sulfurimonas sp.]